MTEPAYDADISIAEPHGGHIKGRPVSWVVVGLVTGGFIAAGVGLTSAVPWLFIVGLAVVALACILGLGTHAMADVTARLERKAARAHAAELRRAAGEQQADATGDAPPRARAADDDADRADQASSQASVRG